MVFMNTASAREHAIKHTKLMEKNYAKQINESVSKTVVCGKNVIIPTDDHVKTIPSVEVVNVDSIHAILDRDKSEKTAVLDFASYMYHGEKYAAGMINQETYLFHHSYLYEVLTMFVNTYYEYNNEHRNNYLFENRALYVPDVIFEDNISRSCDVIVCSAPNWRRASKIGVNETQNSEALKSRMKFIKAITEANKVETLILGAWGCGIFKQDPKEVAETFKQIFKYSTIKNIVYAVPDAKNFKVFKEVFES